MWADKGNKVDNSDGVDTGDEADKSGETEVAEDKRWFNHLCLFFVYKVIQHLALFVSIDISHDLNMWHNHVLPCHCPAHGCCALVVTDTVVLPCSEHVLFPLCPIIVLAYPGSYG